jgi:hypothetical protein
MPQSDSLSMRLSAYFVLYDVDVVWCQHAESIKQNIRRLLTLTGAKEENHERAKEASQNSVPLAVSLQSFLGHSAALLKRPIEEPDRFGRMPLLAAAFQLLTGHFENTVAIFITQSPSLRAVIARPRNRRPSVRSRYHERSFPPRPLLCPAKRHAQDTKNSFS